MPSNNYICCQRPKAHQKSLQLDTACRVTVRKIEIFNVYREKRDTWWPGEAKVSPSTRQVVSTRSHYLQDILDKPRKALAKAVVPAAKSVPTAAVVLREVWACSLPQYG